MDYDNDKFDKYNNYIVAEINITDYDVNRDIRIINSFENIKKEYHLKDMEEDYKYENEKK